MNDTITKIVALLFEDLEETDETVALHDEIRHPTVRSAMPT